MAIDGGLSAVGAIAGETKGEEKNFDSSTSKDKVDEFFRDTAGDMSLPGLINDGSTLIGSIARGLFGKKTRTSTKVNVKDSGWSLTKTWNQPQFDIIRYGIGLRELTIAQFTYVPVSEVVSKPWLSPKEISKISLIVDQFIPPQFSPGTQYIEYYIKPDIEETEWTRINPLSLPTIFESGGSIIPRIISFNTEKPINSRLEDSYIITKQPVKAVRFRAVLKRPEVLEDDTISASSYTPILKSYRLIINTKEALGV